MFIPARYEADSALSPGGAVSQEARNRLVQHAGEQVSSSHCSLGDEDGENESDNCKHSMGHADDLATISKRQYPQRALLPTNCKLELPDATIAFSLIELNDECIIYFDTSVKHAKITVDTLTLHGKSTIDLTSRVTLPPSPSKPPTPLQPGDSLPAQTGSDGTRGGDGRAGTGLNMTVH